VGEEEVEEVEVEEIAPAMSALHRATMLSACNWKD
jgi:hypothetical protein